MSKRRSEFRSPKLMGDLKQNAVVRITTSPSLRPLCGVLKVFTIEEGVQVFVVCHSDMRTGWGQDTGIARIDAMVGEACSETGFPFGIAIFDMDSTEQFILKIVSVKRFFRVLREWTSVEVFEVSDKTFTPAKHPEEKPGRVSMNGEGSVASVLVDGVRYSEYFIGDRPVSSVLTEVQELADKMKRLLLQVKRHAEYFPKKPDAGPAATWYAITDPVRQLTTGTRVRFKYKKVDGTGESEWCAGCIRRSWNQVSREMIYALQHGAPLLGVTAAAGSDYPRVSIMRFRQSPDSLYCTKKELPELMAPVGITAMESSEKGCVNPAVL